MVHQEHESHAPLVVQEHAIYTPNAQEFFGVDITDDSVRNPLELHYIDTGELALGFLNGYTQEQAALLLSVGLGAQELPLPSASALSAALKDIVNPRSILRQRDISPDNDHIAHDAAIVESITADPVHRRAIMNLSRWLVAEDYTFDTFDRVIMRPGTEVISTEEKRRRMSWWGPGYFADSYNRAFGIEGEEPPFKEHMTLFLQRDGNNRLVRSLSGRANYTSPQTLFRRYFEMNWSGRTELHQQFFDSLDDYRLERLMEQFTVDSWRQVLPVEIDGEEQYMIVDNADRIVPYDMMKKDVEFYGRTDDERPGEYDVVRIINHPVLKRLPVLELGLEASRKAGSGKDQALGYAALNLFTRLHEQTSPMPINTDADITEAEIAMFMGEFDTVGFAPELISSTHSDRVVRSAQNTAIGLVFLMHRTEAIRELLLQKAQEFEEAEA